MPFLVPLKAIRFGHMRGDSKVTIIAIFLETYSWLDELPSVMGSKPFFEISTKISVTKIRKP